MNSRKDSRIKVGKIVSAVGIKGEVKVYPYTDYPQRFEELDCVYAGDEKLQIEKVRYQKNVVIRKLESNEEELEEIYEKLQLIYEEAQEYEKVWEISREAVEVLPDSERLWMNYLERYCENPEMERELCAEAVKKAIQAFP